MYSPILPPSDYRLRRPITSGCNVQAAIRSQDPMLSEFSDIYIYHFLLFDASLFMAEPKEARR
jgi:hypothetical protein